MTDLQPQDLELLKKYEEELEGLDMLPPATIELPAPTALALITHIQIASQSQDPVVALNPLLPRAIEGAKQIQSSFSPESATYQVLELGWQEQGSGEDVPQVLRTSLFQHKKLKGPPPYRHHF
jgi:hypothetical protein